MTSKEDIKSRLIAAHRSGDWEAAKTISQEREQLKSQEKREPGTCGICGVIIQKRSRHCYMHSRNRLYWKRALPFAAILILLGCHRTIPPMPLPAMPAITKALPGTVTVRATWDRVPAVDAYSLYWWQGDNYAGQLRVPATTNSCVITNLALGTQYRFAVTAIDSFGYESAFSQFAFYPPIIRTAIGLYIEVSTNLMYIEPSSWTTLTNIDVLTLTNPAGQMNFRSRMTITNTSQ